jgi:hypothetical protein
MVFGPRTSCARIRQAASVIPRVRLGGSWRSPGNREITSITKTHVAASIAHQLPHHHGNNSGGPKHSPDNFETQSWFPAVSNISSSRVDLSIRPTRGETVSETVGIYDSSLVIIGSDAGDEARQPRNLSIYLSLDANGSTRLDAVDGTDYRARKWSGRQV